jgi:Fe-S cluster assembly ATPase SufC
VVYNNTIRVENLNVTIEGQHILKDINLAIPEKALPVLSDLQAAVKRHF